MATKKTVTVTTILDRSFIDRRAKSIPKDHCSCGATMHKGELACASCYAAQVRKELGLAPPEADYKLIRTPTGHLKQL